MAKAKECFQSQNAVFGQAALAFDSLARLGLDRGAIIESARQHSSDLASIAGLMPNPKACSCPM
jgi:hypothetical protein